MEEVALKDLDFRLFKQIENVRKVLAENPSYAVDVMSSIVKRHPGCLEARKILRQAQQHAYSCRRANSLKNAALKLNSRLLVIRNAMKAKAKKDPLEAITEAEKALNLNPLNLCAHKMVGASAEALNLLETATFAYEEMYKIDSKDAETVEKLMLLYIHLGKYDAAIRLGDFFICRGKHPANEKIQSLIKKASVDQSIQEGNWDTDGNYRNKS